MKGILKHTGLLAIITIVAGLALGLVHEITLKPIALAKEQIRLVFEQAQKEVDDLHQRTAEGLITAKMNGKQIGQPKGAKLQTKKSIRAKQIIRKYSADFDGSLQDKDVIKLAGISRNTFYEYKRQLREDRK